MPTLPLVYPLQVKNKTYQVHVLATLSDRAYICLDPEPTQDISLFIHLLHELHKLVQAELPWILCLTAETYQTCAHEYHLPYPGSHWNLNWHGKNGWRYELEIGIPIS